MFAMALALMLAYPAQADPTVVCVIYRDQQVSQIVFPDDDADCDAVELNGMAMMKLPLNDFGTAPSDPSEALRIAAKVQRYVEGLLATAR